MMRAMSEEAEGARPAATLASVARLVGVSLNTVSRALRAPQTVRPELRRRIDAALEELDYVPNRLAGGLAGARSAIVGVVITSLFHSEFSAVVDALQTVLSARGLEVMLGHSRYDPEEELRLVRSMLSWRPAAVALIGLDHHPRVPALLRGAGMPTVEMWDSGGEAIDSAVGMDHVAIGRAQAAHLAAAGCRRLAFIGSMRPHDTRAQKRAQGLALHAEEAGLPPPLRLTRPIAGHPDLGEALLAELLEAHPRVDGIVCNSDAVAFGVLRGLRGLGRSVPRDCGVVGFGDADAAACMLPALTSIRPPREEIGRVAAETILARMHGAPSRHATLDWTLVSRDSTARIRKGG
jgi:LacI family transcriptional regulator, gluconate utilization system Gnt-I transcriptional repressor